MSVQKTLEVLRMRKLMGMDELIAENFDVCDDFENLSEAEWTSLPKEMRAIIEDKKHVLTYSYGDSSFKLKPIKVNNEDEDVPDLAKPSDYEKNGGDAKKANNKMIDNQVNESSNFTYTYQKEENGKYSIWLTSADAGDKKDMVGSVDSKAAALKEVDKLNAKLEESVGISQETRDNADLILKHKRVKWGLEDDKDPEDLDFEAKKREQDEKKARLAKADEILGKSRLANAKIKESYQNRQEFDNDEDADVYFGHKHPRETKVILPDEVKKAIEENIERIKDYMNDNSEKEFKDGEKAIDAMEYIKSELAGGDYEGFLKAQMHFQTLSGPIADFFPAELVTFLSTGHQNQDGDSGYNKEIEPYETELPTNNTLPFQNKTPDQRLSESYMFSREEKFNQFFIDEILPNIVKEYGFSDKSAINTAYNDILDSYERDGVLPADSRDWTLPQDVIDNPSNYITESTRIVVEHGSNYFDVYNTAIETWFERDRQYVGLYPVDDAGEPDTNKNAIVEWWDEEVSEAIENGVLDPRDWHGSALDYAKHTGLIKESKKINIRKFMKYKKT